MYLQEIVYISCVARLVYVTAVCVVCLVCVLLID